MMTPKGTRPLLPGTLQNLFFPPKKYEYFALAGKFPFENGDPVVRAAWAADASMLSYAHCGSQPMPDVDFRTHLARAGLNDVRKIGDWTLPEPRASSHRTKNSRFLLFAEPTRKIHSIAPTMRIFFQCLSRIIARHPMIHVQGYCIFDRRTPVFGTVSGSSGISAGVE